MLNVKYVPAAEAVIQTHLRGWTIWQEAEGQLSSVSSRKQETLSYTQTLQPFPTLDKSNKHTNNVQLTSDNEKTAPAVETSHY